MTIVYLLSNAQVVGSVCGTNMEEIVTPCRIKSCLKLTFINEKSIYLWKVRSQISNNLFWNIMNDDDDIRFESISLLGEIPQTRDEFKSLITTELADLSFLPRSYRDQINETNMIAIFAKPYEKPHRPCGIFNYCLII